MQLHKRDKEFKELAEAEELNTKKELGQYINVDEKERQIIGKQRMGHVIEDITKERMNEELTVQEKVEKELSFLTHTMNLNKQEQKHWFYRLQREYKE